MKSLVSLVFAVIISVAQPVMAALDIELTQGVNAAIPIAILALENQSMVDKDLVNITDVINKDLSHSGRFKTHVQSASSFDPALWRKRGVDNILQGSIQKLENGQYQVKYQLIDVYRKAPQNVLLKQDFTIKAEDFRQLAHFISDQIYAQLTGDKGVFSTRIAYVLVIHKPGEPVEYRLEISDIDGYNAKPLLKSSNPVMSASWAPDGRRIAYVSFEKGRSSVYVEDVISGKREEVARYTGINSAPAWSPDGKQLAIVLSKDGSPSIYALDLTTKQFRRLTHGDSIDTEPNWSHDGRYILFTSNRGGGPQIYRLTLSNGHIDRLSFDGRYNARASFLPDDKQIVMMHRGDVGIFNIAVLDLRSSQLTELTQVGLNESPSISPNGKMIMYATRFGGRGVLSMVSIDGRVKLRLPAREGDVQEPAWSPYLNS